MRDMGQFIGLVAVVMLFGIPVIGVVGHYGYTAFKAWLEIGLKRDMVARGYTAQEIVAVLGATKGASEAECIKVLSDGYFSAEEIAEVMTARKQAGGTGSLPDVPPAKPVRQPVM